MKKALILSIFFIILTLFSCFDAWNKNVVSEAIREDTTSPIINITSPINDSTYGIGNIIIQGDATDDLKLTKVEISVDGGAFLETNNMGFSVNNKKFNWVYYFDLNTVADINLHTVTTHTITARATDQWNNVGTSSISINVDNVLVSPKYPVAELSGLPPVATKTSSIDVTVGGDEVVAYRYNIDGGSFSATIGVNTNITKSGLSIGTHTLTVVGINAGGIQQSAIDGPTRYTWTVATDFLLEASTPISGSTFGYTVSSSSDGATIITGAEAATIGSLSHCGMAYIYKWNSGTSSWGETKITSSDKAAYDNFGRSVSISGNGQTALVGAYRKNNYNGAAYIYKWNSGTSSWGETKITPSDGGNNSFGQSVDISGNGENVIIGAWGNFNNSSCMGAAYIYKWNSGTSSWGETKITSSDRAIRDNFGYSVSISDDGQTALVGARGKNSSRGAAYIYKWNSGTSSWGETKITPSDSSENDYFAQSVSISGDGQTAIIRGFRNNNPGVLYFYKWNSGTSSWGETKITPSNLYRNPTNHYNQSVSISADGKEAILGGAYKSNTGFLYIYKWNSGTSSWISEEVNISNSYYDYFGQSVAVSSDGAFGIVGAYGKNSNTGGIYIISLY